MPRAIISIVLAAFIVSIPYMGYYLGAFWDFAFFIILSASLIFGVPALYLLRYARWNSWWIAVIVGGLIPQILGIFNSAIYIFVYHTALGMAAGLIVWFVGMFRNPAFKPAKTKIPRSLVFAPLGAILIVMYLNALGSEKVFGCITKYELVENPTSWRHSIITIVTDDGDTAQDSLPVGSSKPEILGSCTQGSRKKTASLQDYVYSFHSFNANECVQVCAAFKQESMDQSD